MFVKLKVDGSEKITKIKYEGQPLKELKEIIAKKLDFDHGFDIKYLDEDQDTVIIKDQDDWDLCKESYQDISKSTASSALNISLIITPLPGTPGVLSPTVTVVEEKVQPAPPTPIETTKASVETKASSDFNYPQPPVVEQQPPVVPQHSIQVTVSQGEPIPVFQPVLEEYISTLFGSRGKPPAPNAVVQHFTITCDGCGMSPLTGPRFKSVTINDFDLCETCANLPVNSNKVFIRIPYFNNQECQTGYNVREFPQIIKLFTKFVKEPVSEEEALAVKLMKEVFVGADKQKIENFVKKHQSKSFNDLYLAYIKENHL